jgi:molecular chaperone Hsp33
LLQRFLFEGGAVRGEIVHLDATWCAVLERHDYPPVVRDLLGQFMAAGALLAATLKFSGSLIMQVQAQGPVNLLVIECTSNGTMRATAQWSSVPMDPSLDSLFDNGRLIITLDPEKGKERYQGIVELTGRSVAEVLQNYLERSEQIDTRLWLTASDSRVAGMLLQKLPDRETDDEDIWRRVVHLGRTVTDEELLTLGARDIMHRLFHEEDIRVFDPEPIRFSCSCSRDRVVDVLKMLGQEEVGGILEDEGVVDVNCEFCNQNYVFDKVDVEQLFSSEIIKNISPTIH